jgi:hypothetical protein
VASAVVVEELGDRPFRELQREVACAGASGPRSTRIDGHPFS